MNKIIMSAIAFVAIMMGSLTAQAQLNITFKNPGQEDYQDYMEASGNHPGGWNFDIIGIRGGREYQRGSSAGKTIRLPHIVIASGFGFGFTSTQNAPAQVDTRMGRSFNFSIQDLLAIKLPTGPRSALSVGLGIDYRNYRMTGTQRFMEDPSKQIYVTGYQPDTVSVWSKIRTRSTTFNLKYIQRLGRSHFRMSLGPELYVIPGRSRNHQIVNKYSVAGDEQKERFRNIRTNKVGLNLVANVQYRSFLGMYVKYTPTKVLDSSFGPQFSSLSVGLLLLGF